MKVRWIDGRMCNLLQKLVRMISNKKIKFMQLTVLKKSFDNYNNKKDEDNLDV